MNNNKALYPAKIISVQELLRETGLNIPDYQRPYKWTAKNVRIRSVSESAAGREPRYNRFDAIPVV